MPELPEVETVVVGLKKLLISHRIKHIQSDWAKSLIATTEEIQRHIINAKITAVHRLGKLIILELDSEYTLVIHLKLTGQLVYQQLYSKSDKTSRHFGAGHPSSSLIAKLPDKTTRVTFTLDDNAYLFFNDMRKFGWIKLLKTDVIGEDKSIKHLGPDALTISPQEFGRLLSRRRKKIKSCLLDQSILAGCGNIYADEALWLSRIHPQTPAFQLEKQQLNVLCEKLQQVLQLSIEQGGSSSKNYINAQGEKGRYLNFVKVYQRTGLPCKRCQTNIKKIIVGGRGTHFCNICQNNNKL